MKLKPSRINKAWHKHNPLSKKSSANQKIQWHSDHERECGCRPIPKPIALFMQQRKPKVVVSVLAQYNNTYLLVRERLEDGKDKWIIPGGKVEFGESLETAAKRELLEETGIKAKGLQFLHFHEALFPKYNYHTVIFFYEATTTKNKLSPDIEGKVLESRWVTIKEATKLPLVESAVWLFKRLGKT